MADTTLNTQHVTQHIPAMCQRDLGLLSNVRAMRDAIIDAVPLYTDAEAGDQSKLQELRASLLQLVRQEQAVRAHKRALVQLQAQYAAGASLDKSDFAALLQQLLDAQPPGPDPECDEDVQEFDSLAGPLGNGTGSEELGEGEELAIEGGVEKNDRCPYTLKPLLELREPVEDQRGFVYEGAAVRGAIAASQQGWVESPIIGTRHLIRPGELKPCKRIERAQKQQRLAAGIGGAGGAGPSMQAGGGAGPSTQAGTQGRGRGQQRRVLEV